MDQLSSQSIGSSEEAVLGTRSPSSSSSPQEYITTAAGPDPQTLPIDDHLLHSHFAHTRSADGVS